MSKDQSCQPKDSYAAIRALSRPISRRHPPMARSARAAQFAPFSALTGYEDVIAEAERLTEQRLSLDEDTLERLNQQLNWLINHAREHPQLHLRFFVADEKKAGGAYIEEIGVLKKVDLFHRLLMLQSGLCVSLDDIAVLEVLPSESIVCASSAQEMESQTP